MHALRLTEEERDERGQSTDEREEIAKRRRTDRRAQTRDSSAWKLWC